MSKRGQRRPPHPVASLDMLTLIRKDDETFTLVSDDANAENVGVGEAIDKAAPHLLDQYENTEADDDGALRLDFPADEWENLLEILESIPTDYVDPTAIDTMVQEVDAAVKERNA